MYESPIGRDVRLSFRELADHPDMFTDADAELLRRRIAAAVDELKEKGWPIERVVVRVKELAAEVGLSLGSPMCPSDRHPAIAKAVLWSVERFYGEDLDARR